MVSKKGVAMLLCGVFGVACLVVGGVLIHVFDQLIHSEVKSNIPLKPGSDSYKNWKEPKAPIYFQVWMFDVVNYLDVMDSGAKPAVEQIGPFTYREFREKLDIHYLPNGTVKYRETRTFVFQPQLSAFNESKKFHCVNLPMLTLIDMVKNEFSFIKDIVQAALKITGERLFTELTVHDLMWGYPDPLLEKVDELAKPFFNFSLPYMFGLFYNQNDTDDGIYEVYSGLNGTDQFGEIVSWNGMEALEYWTSDLANSINGSDGTLYPPFYHKADTKYLFSSDLCRSLGMVFNKDITIRGIDLNRFVAPDIMFGNVTINPYNAGFCTPSGDCLPSGLLNVSVCREGAPIVMSMPHFLGCDPDTQNAVEGLHPNRLEHQSFIDLEPMTGVVMNAGKKLQINVYITKVDKFPDTYNVGPIYMPIMWLNESAMIDEKDASDFRSEVLDKLKILDAVKYGLMALGAFIMILVVLILIKRKLSNSKKPLSINGDGVEPLLTAHA